MDTIPDRINASVSTSAFTTWGPPTQVPATQTLVSHPTAARLVTAPGGAKAQMVLAATAVVTAATQTFIWIFISFGCTR
jgi:hypothetical protein